MSLRARLLLTVVVVLLASFAAGGVYAWWTATRSVAAEMNAALDVSESIVRNAVAHLPETSDRRLYLEQLVATFDGDRHVRTTLKIADRTDAVSTLDKAESVSDWFYRLVGVKPDVVRVDIAGETPASIIIETDPHNEVREVWDRSGDDLVIMATFSVLSLALLYWITSQGLKPLHVLAGGFRTIEAGNYRARLATKGPRELAALAGSFNAMAANLDELARRNQRLHQQLLTIQEEERSDLARDLHDEVGPFLFAVNVDAAAIARLAPENAAVDEQVKSIQDAVGHMQRHVRDILNRLRPTSLEEVGLRQAVNNLVLFWQRRHSDLRIIVDMAAVDDLPETYETAIYRLIQESLSNAVRHGHAKRIDVRLRATPEALTLAITDDGAGLAGGFDGGGFGLMGMRERIVALGGTLSVANRDDGGGVRVSAQLPLDIAHMQMAAE